MLDLYRKYRCNGVRVSMTKICLNTAAALAMFCGGAVSLAEVQTIMLGASSDAALYEDEDGASANGAGDFLFSGTTAQDEIRRSLLQFDIASVLPAHAVVQSVTLEMYMSRTIVGDTPVALHRVTTAWSEGPADADGPEGIGAAAQSGDVTWQHASFDDVFWENDGGDFDAQASAISDIAFEGDYTWSGAGLIEDVQLWLNDPSVNHGWMLLGDESQDPTAKRWNSRTNSDEATRPLLTIEYAPEPSSLALLSLAGVLAMRGRNSRA